MSDNDNSTAENIFLKEQNKAFLEIVECQEAASFYYSRLYALKSVDQMYAFLVEFITELFAKRMQEVWASVYLFQDDLLEPRCMCSLPDDAQAAEVEAELHEQVEEGVVAWGIQHKKITCFETVTMQIFKYGIFIPLVAGKKTMGFVFLLINTPHTALPQSFMDLLQYCCVNTSVFIDYVNVNQVLTEQTENLEKLVAVRTKELKDVNMRLQTIATIMAEKCAEAENARDAKSRFFASMSHELRTPTHGILSFAKFGLTDLAKGKRDGLDSYFSMINENAERLLLLLNDLLDLAKIEAGKMVYTFTNEKIVLLIRKVFHHLDVMSQEKEISLRCSYSDDAQIVQLDAEKFFQAMINLVSNAIRFSHPGGYVVVAIDDVENGKATRISVIDNGVGIPEGELEAVFDMFVQSSFPHAKKGGTGLGLCIAREIVAGHGGALWAEHNPEGGAIFRCKIPRMQKKIMSKETRESEEGDTHDE